MKTGVETIADKLYNICVREGADSKIPLSISILRWSYEYLNDGKYGHAIRCLSEAGALIAAEIDRINKLSTK